MSLINIKLCAVMLLLGLACSKGSLGFPYGKDYNPYALPKVNCCESSLLLNNDH
jgi:hypothetical protein